MRVMAGGFGFHPDGYGDSCCLVAGVCFFFFLVLEAKSVGWVE